jgi:hypothetical protein
LYLIVRMKEIVDLSSVTGGVMGKGSGVPGLPKDNLGYFNLGNRTTLYSDGHSHVITHTGLSTRRP